MEKVRLRILDNSWFFDMTSLCSSWGKYFGQKINPAFVDVFLYHPFSSKFLLFEILLLLVLILVGYLWTTFNQMCGSDFRNSLERILNGNENENYPISSQCPLCIPPANIR